MGSFFDFGKAPEGKATLTPLVPDTEPRGKSSDGFHSLIKQQRADKEAMEDYWDNFAKENEFSKTGYLGKTLSQESVVANLFGKLEDYAATYDPQFDPEPYINKDWPTWRQEAVLEAKNDEHAELLIKKTEEQDLYNKEGQYLGGTATALQLVGAVINPENHLLGIGELTALTKLGFTGGKAILSGATFGSLTNAGMEAAIVANNKSRDKAGIALAASFGGVLGAGGGFLTGRITKKALADAQKLDNAMGKGFSNAWKRDMDIATGDLTPNVTVFRSPDAKLWDEAVEAGGAGIDVDGSYVVQMGDTAFKYNTKAQATAAMNLRKRDIEITPKRIEEQMNTDYHAAAKEYDASIPKRKLGAKYNLLKSIGLEGLSSSNPFTRKLTSLIVEDASGTGGKNVATHSAALKADIYAMQMRAAWHPERLSMGKQWMKEVGLRQWKPWDDSAMRKFDSSVVQEIAWRGNPSSRPTGHTALPSIKKAADAYQQLQDIRIKRLRESGVDGFDDIDLTNLHFSHKWDGIAMTKVAQQFDKGFVIKLLKQAILRGNEFNRTHKYAKLGSRLTDQYKDRTATNMAHAIYERFTRRPDTVNMARASLLSKKDIIDLRARAERLIDNEADLKHLLAATSGKDSRLVNDTLSQIDMDINTTMDGIAVRDLMDTNLGSSIDTDIRRSAGKSAMADMGFKDQADFLEFTEQAGRWNRENVKGAAAKDLEIMNTKNQKLWNIVMGENLERDANTTIANVARGVRKMSTLASLNQVGFAQLAETGRLVGALGIKGVIKQIPQFNKMIRRMKNGTFKDPILNDIESAFGVRLGDNHILSHPALLAEQGGVDIATADAKGFIHGMQTAMNKSLHVQGYLNGMNMVMRAQHRMHARGFFMRMWDDLQKAKVSPGRMRRYADMGLSPEDLKLVKSNMDSKTQIGEGWLGQKRPTDFRLVEFDAGVREKLLGAFWKNQSQAIQRNMGGETAWWMESTSGKLFSQFRTFPLVAIEKQLVHDAKFLKHLDPEVFITGAASLAFAGLAYTAKTYANSFGLPAKKRKQYLKNRLTPESIFAGASAWSGQAAIFPDVMNMGGDFGFDNPWAYSATKGNAYRNYYRERGLDAGDVLGASGSLVDSAYKFASGVGQAALTPADWRNDTFKHGIRAIPFGNNIAVKALANTLIE